MGIGPEHAARDAAVTAGAEFDRLKLKLGIINFTPFYDHADSETTTADYITMVYGSLPAFAEGWDKWEKSAPAAKVMKSRTEVGDAKHLLGKKPR